MKRRFRRTHLPSEPRAAAPVETELEITRLAVDGDGLGQVAEGERKGQTAFVSYSAPGDRLAVRMISEKKSLSRWIPTEVLVPSERRVEPACPLHFSPDRKGAWCGGCNWQHMSGEGQLVSKRELVLDALTRIGGFTNPPVEKTVASPEAWRYRNKVQVPFGRGRRSGIAAGFYAPGTHEIVDFDDCLIQPEPVVEFVAAVKRWAREWHWQPYDEDLGRGWLRHLLVRSNRRGDMLVTLVTAGRPFRDRDRFVHAVRKEFPSVVGLHQNVQPGRTNVVLGQEWVKLWGQDHITEMIGGLVFGASAGAFFQVNTGAAEKLFDLAVGEMAPTPDMAVLDLYGGVGVLALLSARSARTVIGVEVVPQAIRDAEENARRNKISNAVFKVAQAERAFAGRPPAWFAPYADLPLGVFLDPPRSGCEPAVLDALLALRPLRIVYVSCHPATLARDLKTLSRAYDITRITPVDLFPQTAHVETVVRLERRA